MSNFSAKRARTKIPINASPARKMAASSRHALEIDEYKALIFKRVSENVAYQLWLSGTALLQMQPRPMGWLEPVGGKHKGAPSTSLAEICLLATNVLLWEPKKGKRFSDSRYGQAKVAFKIFFGNGYQERKRSMRLTAEFCAYLDYIKQCWKQIPNSEWRRELRDVQELHRLGGHSKFCKITCLNGQVIKRLLEGSRTQPWMCLLSRQCQLKRPRPVEDDYYKLSSDELCTLLSTEMTERHKELPSWFYDPSCDSVSGTRRLRTDDRPVFSRRSVKNPGTVTSVGSRTTTYRSRASRKPQRKAVQEAAAPEPLVGVTGSTRPAAAGGYPSTGVPSRTLRHRSGRLEPKPHLPDGGNAFGPGRYGVTSDSIKSEYPSTMTTTRISKNAPSETQPSTVGVLRSPHGRPEVLPRSSSVGKTGTRPIASAAGDKGKEGKSREGKEYRRHAKPASRSSAHSSGSVPASEHGSQGSRRPSVPPPTHPERDNSSTASMVLPDSPTLPGPHFAPRVTSPPLSRTGSRRASTVQSSIGASKVHPQMRRQRTKNQRGSGDSSSCGDPRPDSMTLAPVGSPILGSRTRKPGRYSAGRGSGGTSSPINLRRVYPQIGHLRKEPRPGSSHASSGTALPESPTLPPQSPTIRSPTWSLAGSARASIDTGGRETVSIAGESLRHTRGDTAYA
jgi:hypothetical protein